MSNSNVAATVSDTAANMLMLNNIRNIYKSSASAIREIANNGLDAHKQNDTAKSVQIHVTESTDGIVAIRDFGAGMSQKFMNEYFMSFGQSTKKVDDTSSIGNFGQGSKSPLSHADYCLIRSIHKGVATEYALYIDKASLTLNLQTLTDNDEAKELWGCVADFIKSGDVDLLENMDFESDGVLTVWPLKSIILQELADLQLVMPDSVEWNFHSIHLDTKITERIESTYSVDIPDNLISIVDKIQCTDKALADILGNTTYDTFGAKITQGGTFGYVNLPNLVGFTFYLSHNVLDVVSSRDDFISNDAYDVVLRELASSAVDIRDNAKAVAVEQFNIYNKLLNTPINLDLGDCDADFFGCYSDNYQKIVSSCLGSVFDTTTKDANVYILRGTKDAIYSNSEGISLVNPSLKLGNAYGKYGKSVGNFEFIASPHMTQKYKRLVSEGAIDVHENPELFTVAQNLAFDRCKNSVCSVGRRDMSKGNVYIEHSMSSDRGDFKSVLKVIDVYTTRLSNSVMNLSPVVYLVENSQVEGNDLDHTFISLTFKTYHKHTTEVYDELKKLGYDVRRADQLKTDKFVGSKFNVVSSYLASMTVLRAIRDEHLSYKKGLLSYDTDFMQPRFTLELLNLCLVDVGLEPVKSLHCKKLSYYIHCALWHSHNLPPISPKSGSLERVLTHRALADKNDILLSFTDSCEVLDVEYSKLKELRNIGMNLINEHWCCTVGYTSNDITFFANSEIFPVLDLSFVSDISDNPEFMAMFEAEIGRQLNETPINS